MHWYDGYGAGYGGMVMMVLTGLVLLGGVVALVVLAMRQSSDRRPQDDSGSAQRILEARLARGEIDADEFERVRDLLRSR
jgi:putative membrane protein